jgi:hypothetical protein
MGGMNRRRRKKLQQRVVTAAGWAEAGRVAGEIGCAAGLFGVLVAMGRHPRSGAFP